MGDILEEPIDKVNVLVVVDDKDEKTSKIELFEDGVVVQTDAPNSASRHWETTFNPAPGKALLFCQGYAGRRQYAVVGPYLGDGC